MAVLPANPIQVGDTTLLPGDSREQHRQKFARISLDSLAYFIGLLDVQGRVLDLNRTALETGGLTLAEVAGRPLGETFWWQASPEAGAQLQDALARAAQGESVHWETQLRGRAPREIIAVDASLIPVKDGAGRVIFITVEGRDITERKSQEQEIGRQRQEATSALEAARQAGERQQRLHEVVASNTPDLIYVFDLEHRFTYANKALLAMWGRSWDDAIGKNCLELGYEPWHAEMHGREIDEVVATRQSVRGEVAFNGTNGRRLYDYIFVPVIGARGEVEAVAGTTRDVTEGRKATTAARFVADLIERLMLLDTETDIIRETVGAVGRHCGVHRCYFVEFLERENLVQVGPNWVRDDAPSLAGRFNLRDFGGADWWREYWKGDFAVSDTARHPLINAEQAQNYAALHVRAYTVQPIRRVGDWKVVLAVTEDQPRQWTEAELRLLDNVAARVWPLVERVRSEAALRAARDEALAASRAKDDFLAALSHELRTPLNPVLLLASEAANDPRLPAETRADFATIVRNVALEARLIDDLLDLTCITHNKLVLHLHRHDLHSLLGQVAGTLQQDLRERNLTLDISLAAPATTVSGDEVRLQQVFWNLLRNAVKFTPRGGRIVLTSFEPPDQPGVIAVEVTDTGIGLTAPEIEKVFDPFAQGEHSESGKAQYGGLGLGLAISRKIVELHTGTITARSAGRNLGATFAVHLPLVATATPAAPSLASPPAAASTHRFRRVLLVEDHEPSRKALSRLLTNRGIDVVSAGSATEALAKARTEAFDLVISDLGLPDGNGCDLMTILQTRHGCRGIALSGYGTERDIAHSREAGFMMHLTKPVEAHALDRVLAEFGRE